MGDYEKLCSNYNCARTTRRWPMVVFYSSLNVAGINSLVVHTFNNQNKLPMVRREFIRSLAMEMLQPHLRERVLIQSTPRNIKLRIKEICNLQEDQEVASSEKTSGRCYYCDSKKNRKTRYFCKSCKKFMCLEHVIVVCDACYNDNLEN